MPTYIAAPLLIVVCIAVPNIVMWLIERNRHD